MKTVAWGRGTNRAVIEVAAAALIFVGLVSANAIGIYAGENKGVFAGDCGIEFVGDPGFFCTPSYEPMGSLISASK